MDPSAESHRMHTDWDGGQCCRRLPKNLQGSGMVKSTRARPGCAQAQQRKSQHHGDWSRAGRHTTVHGQDAGWQPSRADEMLTQTLSRQRWRWSTCECSITSVVRGGRCSSRDPACVELSAMLLERAQPSPASFDSLDLCRRCFGAIVKTRDGWSLREKCTGGLCL